MKKNLSFVAVIIFALITSFEAFASPYDGMEVREITVVYEQPKGFISLNKIEKEYQCIAYPSISGERGYLGYEWNEQDFYFVDYDCFTIFQSHNDNKDFIVKYKDEIFIHEKIFKEIILKKAQQSTSDRQKIYKIGDEIPIYADYWECTDILMSIDSVNYVEEYDGITLNDEQWLSIIHFSISNESKIENILEKCFRKVETAYGKTETTSLTQEGSIIECFPFKNEQNEKFIKINENTVAFKLEKKDKVKYIFLGSPFIGISSIRKVDVSPELSAVRTAYTWLSYKVKPNKSGILKLEKKVDVRVVADFSKATIAFDVGYANDIISGSTSNHYANWVKSVFDTHFDNVLTVINMKYSGKYGMAVNVATKIPVTRAKSLYFYSYNENTEKYKQIKNTNAKIDKNGYVHFDTDVGGNIIISDGPLKK